jgi:glycosyltransferase involved in cell wall biosynthesis
MATEPTTIPLASLFVFHCSANTGYAIAPLERLFYKAGLELADGDSRRVHFAYRTFEHGRPTNLPADLTNVLEFDSKKADSSSIQRVADYAQRNGIGLALFFDIQPVHPVFRPLRRAGVHTILSYWGATISPRVGLWKLTLKRLQVSLSRSKVDGLIFESQAMADLAIYGRGVPPHMIDVIPLGVDTKLYQPDRSDYVYEAMGLAKDRKVVIYVGHMEKRKGVLTLIEAAIELLAKRHRSDVCFLLFGNKGDQSREFEQMYQGLGIEKFVRFGGYRDDLPKVYPGCFCGVIPSTGWDSFTTSAVEMAACGLPVVASRLQGLCEAVLDDETGVLFPPGNSQALADHLERLLDDPDRAERYGKQGRKRCEMELSHQAHYERFMQVLRKRLGPAPAC